MASDVSKNLSVPPGSVFLMTIMPQITESVLDSFLKLVYDTILKHQISPRTFDTLYEKSGLNEQGPLLVGALYALVNYLSGLPQVNVSNDGLRNLCKELKFSDECCNTLINSFEENKSDIIKFKRTIGSPYFLKLKQLNWRIDITVSSSYLCKALSTVIILQLVLKNGKTKTFEVSISKFHQLRFCVADMLREMDRFEKKNALKTE